MRQRRDVRGSLSRTDLTTLTCPHLPPLSQRAALKGGEAYSPLSRLTVQSKLTELEGAVAELGLRCEEASRPNLVECVKAAHAALQAMTPLVKGLDDGAVTVEASGLLSAESLERQATKAKELLSKTSSPGS